jgi:hypothetical protein
MLAEARWEGCVEELNASISLKIASDLTSVLVRGDRCRRLFWDVLQTGGFSLTDGYGWCVTGRVSCDTVEGRLISPEKVLDFSAVRAVDQPAYENIRRINRLLADFFIALSEDLPSFMKATRRGVSARCSIGRCSTDLSTRPLPIHACGSCTAKTSSRTRVFSSRPVLSASRHLSLTENTCSSGYETTEF